MPGLADPVAVGVGERAGVDLVDDAPAPPVIAEAERPGWVDFDAAYYAKQNDAQIDTTLFQLLGASAEATAAQGNRPGPRDTRRVHGHGASDMKGARAVMVELALAGAREAGKSGTGLSRRSWRVMTWPTCLAAVPNRLL